MITTGGLRVNGSPKFPQRSKTHYADIGDLWRLAPTSSIVNFLSIEKFSKKSDLICKIWDSLFRYLK